MMAGRGSSIRLMVTLGIAGLVSGSILVGIYEVTAPRIQRNKAEALERAIFQVLDGAVSKSAFELQNGSFVPFEGPEGSLPEGVAVYAGFDAEGQPLGFAIPAAGAGFQDTIGLIYGYDPLTRKIVGMRVLQSLETPGLGDKIIKDQHFVGQFGDLAVDPEIVSTKKGATEAHEIDAISGATISSNAVVAIINDSIAERDEQLPALELATGEQP